MIGERIDMTAILKPIMWALRGQEHPPRPPELSVEVSNEEYQLRLKFRPVRCAACEHREQDICIGPDHELRFLDGLEACPYEWGQPRV